LVNGGVITKKKVFLLSGGVITKAFIFCYKFTKNPEIHLKIKKTFFCYDNKKNIFFAMRPPSTLHPQPQKTFILLRKTKVS
jgi:hypothetical protein